MRSVHSSGQRPRYAPSPYAPWEFWAHLGLVVLVPATLSFASNAFAAQARVRETPTVPVPSIGDAAPAVRAACMSAAHDRCEETQR